VKLLTRLERAALTEESYFRAWLLQEDLGRLRQLMDLSHSAPDLATFAKDGVKVGWTPGDMRTWELLPTLGPMLEAFYACALTENDANCERLDAAWDVFAAARIDLLVGCLSRVPKPETE